jgi:hypothetical protein
VLALRETAVNPPPSAYVVAAPRPPLMMPTDLRTGHSASAVYYSSRGSAHGAVSQAAEDASEEEEEIQEYFGLGGDPDLLRFVVDRIFWILVLN